MLFRPAHDRPLPAAAMYRRLAHRLGWEWFDTYDGGEWRRRRTAAPRAVGPGQVGPANRSHAAGPLGEHLGVQH